MVYRKGKVILGGPEVGGGHCLSGAARPRESQNLSSFPSGGPAHTLKSLDPDSEPRPFCEPALWELCGLPHHTL